MTSAPSFCQILPWHLERAPEPEELVELLAMHYVEAILPPESE
jgi:hypothetical protein